MGPAHRFAPTKLTLYFKKVKVRNRTLLTSNLFTVQPCMLINRQITNYPLSVSVLKKCSYSSTLSEVVVCYDNAELAKFKIIVEGRDRSGVYR